jgi:surfactin synthase thioesterase subunit
LFTYGSRSPARSRNDILMGISDNDVRDTLLNFGTPVALVDNQSFLEMMQPIILADLRVLGQYTYREHPPLDMLITVILDKMEMHPVTREEGMMWQKETLHPVSIFELDGGIKKGSPELAAIFRSQL